MILNRCPPITRTCGSIALLLRLDPCYTGLRFWIWHINSGNSFLDRDLSRRQPFGLATWNISRFCFSKLAAFTYFPNLLNKFCRVNQFGDSLIKLFRCEIWGIWIKYEHVFTSKLGILDTHRHLYGTAKFQTGTNIRLVVLYVQLYLYVISHCFKFLVCHEKSRPTVVSVKHVDLSTRQASS